MNIRPTHTEADHKAKLKEMSALMASADRVRPQVLRCDKALLGT